jgi:hypothetical protein
MFNLMTTHEAHQTCYKILLSFIGYLMYLLLNITFQ